MMKFLTAGFFLLGAVPVCAQPSEKQRIEDSVIGWFNRPLEKATNPVTYYSKTFSVKQQNTNNLFVEWVQQSYIPVGSLGRVRKYQYSNKRESSPLSYGVLFQTYNVGFKYLDAQKHFTAANGQPAKNTSIELSVTAGNEANYSSNYRGEVRFKLTNYVPKVYADNTTGEFSAPLRSFTNKKTTVHVSLQKKGTAFVLLINDEEITRSTAMKTVYGKDCGGCVTPANTLFNKFGSQNLAQEDGKKIGVYISNIQVSKL